MKLKNFMQGIKDGIPIALGYFAVSFTFGMMAVSGGVGLWPTVLISLTNVTSAGQFAGLDIILAGGSLWELALTQLVINLRYSLMSFSMSQKIADGGRVIHRFFVAFGMTDEIYGISAGREGKVSPYYNYGAISVAIPGWVLGTLIGGVLGNVLPGIVTSALNVAIYGMFLAIIIPPAKEKFSVRMVVVASMILAAIFHYAPYFSKVSSGFVIIIVALVVSGLAALIWPVEEGEESKDAD